MNRGRVYTGLTLIVLAVVLSAAAAAPGQVQTAAEFSGRAAGVIATIGTGPDALTTVTGDTCPLPPRGGTSMVTTSGPLITGVLGTGTITSTTSGSGLTSQSSSSVADFFFSIGGWTIRAQNVSTKTQCNCCDLAVPGCAGETAITGLSITGPSGNFPVTVTGAVNQTVTLPGGAGTIVFNQRPSGSPGEITVNGMHITLVSGGTTYNIIVASSYSDIVCQGSTNPTPIEATVSGRVLTAAGQPLARATVTITDSQGAVRSTSSGISGEYSFAGITAGQAYVLRADAKSYSFQPRAINVLDDMTGIDLRADP